MTSGFNLTAFFRERWQSIKISIGKAIDDFDILAIDQAVVSQAIEKCASRAQRGCRRDRREVHDHWSAGRMLCTHSEWPRDRRAAAEKRYELAPLQSIDRPGKLPDDHRSYHPIITASRTVPKPTAPPTLARARELLAEPSSSKQPETPEAAASDEQRLLPQPCPCCGGRMIISETFARGCEPKHRPTAAPQPIRIEYFNDVVTTYRRPQARRRGDRVRRTDVGLWPGRPTLPPARLARYHRHP